MGCKRTLRLILAAVAAAVCLMGPALASEPVGTVPWLLTATSDRNARYQQCTLGDAEADALRKYLSADIAIVNGGDLIGNLPPGEITQDDLRACLREDRPVAVCRVKGQELTLILESALSHVVTDETGEYIADASAHDAFPQISGFRLSYNPSAQPGERIARLTYNDRPIQPEDSFVLAASVHMLNGGYGLPAVAQYEETDETLISVMESYICDGMEDYSIPKTRINAMGVKSQQFLGRYSIFTLVVICIIMFLLIAPFTRRVINVKVDERK